MIKTRYDYYKAKSDEYLEMSEHARKADNDKLADKLHAEYLNYKKMLDNKEG